MLTYNHSNYIAQAVESVLAQKTDFPYELVIGDDCSTDGTTRIAEEYASRFPNIVRLVTSERNVGASENAQRVRRACKGKYLAWCEGDDYWQRSDKLQMQVDFLEKRLDCGLVCSDYDKLYVENNVRIQKSRRKDSRGAIQSPDINQILMGTADILTCTVLARRSLIENIAEADAFLYSSGHFRMGDTQLWAEVSMRSRIYAIDESLATYRILSESASQSKDDRRRLRFWISNSEMCIYLCDKHNLPAAIKEAHEEIWKRKSLQLAFLERNFDQATQVRQKLGNFSLRNWVWYWGARYGTMRILVRLVHAALQRQF
jgi:glycosyltransferase involved in cell wall biosynthesis